MDTAANLLPVAIMGVGYWLLSRLGVDSKQSELTLAMTVIGIGLGLCMQLYTLVVQNNSARRDLGVATAATQFFRNVGNTIGVAVFGEPFTAQGAAGILLIVAAVSVVVLRTGRRPQ